MRRALAAAVVAGGVLIAGAGPAAADPPEPTDYRSRVERIEPEVDGVEARVVGGDSFLEIEAEPGHEVVVEGYDDEPYLRILADGTVQENQQSRATFINEDRFGAPEPAGLDHEAAPVWVTVADDGTFAWHDHRIHWMGGEPRDSFVRGEPVPNYDPWSVPIVVDGEPAVIEGTLVYEHSVSPLPWVLLAVAGAAVAAIAGWRRRSLAIAVLAAGLGSIGALVAGRAELAAAPDGAGVSQATWLVPAAGVVAAALAALGVGRGRRALAAVAALAATACLAGWAVLRLSVLTEPVLPTTLPAGADRSATALAIGLAVAAAVLAVRSGALAVAVVDDDDD